MMLGDAAHIHSPVGAQGMNTGLQDAYNLAWKLALVVQRRADAALLDSYEAERIPVARRLLNTTDRGFRLAVSEGRLAGLVRTRLLARIAAFAMSRERIQRFAFRNISQTAVRYPASPLSRSLEGLRRDAPRAGDRFPWLQLQLQAGAPVADLFQELDDLRIHLLVFGHASPPAECLEAGDLLRIHVIPDGPINDSALERARIPRPSFYLLRPDGYVGLCGPRLDAAAVVSYVRDSLRLDSRASRSAPASVAEPRG